MKIIKEIGNFYGTLELSKNGIYTINVDGDLCRIANNYEIETWVTMVRE